MIFLTTPLTTKPNTTRTLGLGAIAALFILTACGGGTPATTTTSTPTDLPIDAPMDAYGRHNGGYNGRYNRW